MIEARYRRDYVGEFVITETRLANGVKQESREWIDNPITHSRISNRAAVIFSRFDQDRFQHQRLERHKGGLLGSKRLQTYATGDIWKDMRLDFYISTNRKTLSQIVESRYDEATAVYSGTAGVLSNPGHFYLIPYTPYLTDMATSLYIASFDGHEEIFLLGFNVDIPLEDKNIISDITSVMKAYSSTNYISIGTNAGQPAEWPTLPNFRTMSIRNFITYCDI